jgi:hypothetical protein
MVGRRRLFQRPTLLTAMFTLATVGDKCGYDDADSIVIYFLANAQTCRGDEAPAS